MTHEDIHRMIDDAILNPDFDKATEMIKMANEEMWRLTRESGRTPTRKLVVFDFQRRNCPIEENTPWLIRANPSARNL